ncbi:GNAT family N-acetyltransferase [Herpetosiphon geysericola]|uniref:GNAT family N-acetyltransferase n=1 Tax=Herpetosiphon geysericola TaxID=70996 RepID=UPI0006C92927|nr:GNAT family N-acetyltransferase [Herpetosiphon geysericola]
MHLTSFRFGHASEADYRALAKFEQQIRHERTPADPPMTTAFLVNMWQCIPDFVDYRVWALWDAGQIVATGMLHMLLLDTNRNLADLNLAVLPGHRGRGLARRLLREMLPVVVEAERTVIVGTTTQAVAAGEHFAQKLGAEARLKTQINQLVLAEIDEQLLQQWLQPNQQLSARFELGMWQGPYPEAELAAIVALYEVMNQQPYDDLDYEPLHFSPEQLRELEQTQLANGMQRWTCYVRERATNALAGYTEIFWHRERPHVVQQGDTGVFEHYRNYGLGRWLKAAMVDYMRRELPMVQFVRTTNANSNAPMLKINQALGFKPYLAQTMWQGSLAQIQHYLDQAE